MSGTYVLGKLLEFTGLNGKSFSEKLGLTRPQAIYDIQSGKTQNISSNMADKIISVFPDVNRSWLLSGEGEMLKQSTLPTKLDTDVVINRDIFEKLSLLIDTVCSQQRTIEILVSRSEPTHNNLAASLSKE